MQFCAYSQLGANRVQVFCPNSVVPGSRYCVTHANLLLGEAVEKREVPKIEVKIAEPKIECGPVAPPSVQPNKRTFETGATRDADHDKPDYEGFLSPLSVERYGEYMLKHQLQSDGTRRASDNWQKGIPIAQYVKSLLRHVIQLWKVHRGYPIHSVGREPWPNGKSRDPQDLEEILCAILFNTQGMLHETIKSRLKENKYDRANSIGY